MDGVVVFVAQYLYVLLLGLQSLNVNQRHFVLAAITSFVLGIGGFYLTSVIGNARGQELTAIWYGFVFSGPAGITSAMVLQPHLVRLYARLKKHR